MVVLGQVDLGRLMRLLRVKVIGSGYRWISGDDFGEDLVFLLCLFTLWVGLGVGGLRGSVLGHGL